MLAAVTVPVNVGSALNTSVPVPVSLVNALAKLALEGVVRNVAIPVPKPLTPVLIGRPVQFVSVPELGVPNTGVVSVGLVRVLFVKVCDSVSNTIVPDASGIVTVWSAVGFTTVSTVSKESALEPSNEMLESLSASPETTGLVSNNTLPEPASSVSIVAKLALDGEAKNVATPVPKPLTPVLTGRPVAFVSVALVGVPNAPLNSTTAPTEPVFTPNAVATPVPKPLTPVLTGRPVAFVSVPELGVPNAPPLTITEPELPVLTASADAIPVPKPLIPVATGRPVALVSVPLAGVPNAGATKVLLLLH